jgi:hypothetical protein
MKKVIDWFKQFWLGDILHLSRTLDDRKNNEADQTNIKSS